MRHLAEHSTFTLAVLSGLVSSSELLLRRSWFVSSCFPTLAARAEERLHRIRDHPFCLCSYVMPPSLLLLASCFPTTIDVGWHQGGLEVSCSFVLGLQVLLS